MSVSILESANILGIPSLKETKDALWERVKVEVRYAHTRLFDLYSFMTTLRLEFRDGVPYVSVATEGAKLVLEEVFWKKLVMVISKIFRNPHNPELEVRGYTRVKPVLDDPERDRRHQQRDGKPTPKPNATDVAPALPAPTEQTKRLLNAVELRQKSLELLAVECCTVFGISMENFRKEQKDVAPSEAQQMAMYIATTRYDKVAVEKVAKEVGGFTIARYVRSAALMAARLHGGDKGLATLLDDMRQTYDDALSLEFDDE